MRAHFRSSAVRDDSQSGDPAAADGSHHLRRAAWRKTGSSDLAARDTAGDGGPGGESDTVDFERGCHVGCRTGRRTLEVALSGSWQPAPKPCVGEFLPGDPEPYTSLSAGWRPYFAGDFLPERGRVVCDAAGGIGQQRYCDDADGGRPI